MSGVQLNVRVPAALKTMLEEAAKVSGRTIGRELQERLLRSLVGDAAPQATASSLRPGDRALLAIDGHGIVAAQVVDPNAVRAAIAPPAEPRSPCFEPDSQENWGQ